MIDLKKWVAKKAPLGKNVCVVIGKIGSG